MPKTLTLHIGDPKTGSTSIQRTLQLGLVKGNSIPILGYTNTLNSANAVIFARYFQPNYHKKKSILNVHSWLNKSDGNLVISSEFFSNSDPHHIRKYFEENFPDLLKNIKIIAYVRPHSGRALAAFTERTKAGYTVLEFDSWLKNFIKSETINYTSRFLKWRDAFGDHFILRPYIRNELKNGDVVTDFFSHAVGIENFTLSRTINENQKISLQSLSGLSHFNKELKSNKFNDKIRTTMSLLIAKNLTQNKSDTQPQIEKKHALYLKDSFSEDARSLDEVFFKGKPLFQDALDQTSESSEAGSIDTTLNKHFSTEQIYEINKIISDIKKSGKINITRWKLSYRRFSSSYNIGKKIKQPNNKINDSLFKLATIFSGMELDSRIQTIEPKYPRALWQRLRAKIAI